MPCPNCGLYYRGETTLMQDHFCQCDAANRPTDDRPTLRDQFAMAALTGLVSVAFKFIAGSGEMTEAAIEVKKSLAPVAFSMADAMLAERNRGKE